MYKNYFKKKYKFVKIDKIMKYKLELEDLSFIISLN